MVRTPRNTSCVRQTGEHMIGLQRGTVKLAPYSLQWPILFEEEKQLLMQILGQLALDIQHIGSTAVPNLSAKPIIDIGVYVPDAQSIASSVPPLMKAGYEYFGDRSDTGDHFFAKGSEVCRTHYLHMKVAGNPKWQDDLKFRDCLRTNAAARMEYGMLKQKLASTHAQDRKSYTQTKCHFIQRVLQS